MSIDHAREHELSVVHLGPCPLCGGARQMLPQLSAPSVLSDGRRVDEALAKASCLSCGAVSHAVSRNEDAIRSAYDRDYSLGERVHAAGANRSLSYAELILSALDGKRVSSILDVGCGPGTLLQAFYERFPGIRLSGLEAAERVAEAARRSGLDVNHGFVEDLMVPAERFDLVCAVNVIEHASNPALFLKALARQVAPGGVIAVVCPRADRPNLELLFFDHVHSLTRGALIRLGKAAGLRVVSHRPAPQELGDFQLTMFEAGPIEALGWDESVSAELARERSCYLRTWAGLDDALLVALPGAPLPCFGAGEAAALLRAYAPRTWARVSELVVDEPASAWPLDRTVRRYSAETGASRPMLIAIHPARQDRLAARLRSDGYDPVCWHTIIHR